MKNFGSPESRLGTLFARSTTSVPGGTLYERRSSLLHLHTVKNTTCSECCGGRPPGTHPAQPLEGRQRLVASRRWRTSFVRWIGCRVRTSDSSDSGVLRGRGDGRRVGARGGALWRIGLRLGDRPDHQAEIARKTPALMEDERRSILARKGMREVKQAKEEAD
jgi:hypothetical protein